LQKYSFLQNFSPGFVPDPLNAFILAWKDSAEAFVGSIPKAIVTKNDLFSIFFEPWYAGEM
jgi:hypothetical protein